MSVTVKHRRIFRIIFVTLATCAAIVYIAEDHEVVESRWEPAIQQFEAADEANPPPQNAILFTGSSSIVFWRSLTEDMAPLTVLNRGFGGSQMFELNMFRDRIVTPYDPRAVLIYEGDNDVAAGKQPDEIIAEYRDFVDHLMTRLPETDVYFIAVKPSILRANLWSTMDEVNNALRELADEHDHVRFLDTSTPMLNDDGKIKADLLVDDGLHMNANGYAIWTGVIRPVLMGAYGD
ncbi:MAG: GDSL-type esterase/lipase family protein [Gammaproteobacteria bacterium]|nr:GDSL-type esterase/lipase family protein [Gammaproteobacteria bacterium]